MPKPPLQIGLIGLGTVGTGVAKILTEQADRITRRAGRPIQIRRVIVRDPSKPRGIDLPGCQVTGDVQDLIRDPEIQIAVSLMGGLHPTREIMLEALESGKDVVTADKAVLSAYGSEIFARAHQLGRSVAFEAAVAGGIPIIATVGQSLAANQITEISAILNGTSNFILTEMIGHHQPYADVLKRAQELGYAEADPAMDVDGTDAAQKLIILTQLAFGTKVSLSEFPRRGIDTLELADVKYAAELGYTVKLLAVAKLKSGQLELHVSPTLVRHHQPLAEVQGPFNGVKVIGDVVGETWYSGRGAGQMPTASAVVADLIDMAIGRARLTFEQLGLWQPDRAFPLLPPEQSSSRYYLRFNVEDRPHVLADIADILGRSGISIASVIQHEAPEREGDTHAATVPLVIMTHRTTTGALQTAAEELNRVTAIRPPLVQLRVAD